MKLTPVKRTTTVATVLISLVGILLTASAVRAVNQPNSVVIPPSQLQPSGSDASTHTTPTSQNPDFVVAPEEVESAKDGAIMRDYFDEMSRLPGFQSGGLNDEHSGLEFYWHGELSDEALRIIADAEASGRTVNIIQVKYSEEQLWAYMREFTIALMQEGFNVWSYGPGTRDNFTVDYSGPELSVDPALQKRAREIAEDILPRDVTLRFVPNGTPMTFESRHNVGS